MTTRRSFLQASVSAAALAVAHSSQARAVPPSDRITLGFIGVGKMGRGHLRKLLGNADAQVVAVCDVVQERREDAVRLTTEHYGKQTKTGEYRGVRGHHDFRELLRDDSLDAVVIATPDHWHAIPCRLAAQAGKHIYCEKPLTHNIAEGQHLVRQVAQAGIVFQTGSQQRSEFGGHFRRAVEAIWNGRIGQIQRVRIGVGGPAKPCDLPTEEVPPGTDWDTWVGPAPLRGYNQILCPQGIHDHFPNWRQYQEFAGGGLADMGAHHFDIAQWALKMDTSGPTRIIPPQDEQAGQGLRFIYENGIEMIHNEFEEGIKADCVFEGTDGMILVSRGGISSRPGTILEEPLGADALRVMESSNHHQNWLTAVRAGSTTICPAEVGHRSASICHLANIGYRLKRELKWDPQHEKFVNDNEANQLLSRTARDPWNI
jgi:predicted dehydrogenase